MESTRVMSTPKPHMTDNNQGLEVQTKFDARRVRDVLHEALEKKYSSWTYDANTANAKAKEVTRFVLNSLSDKDRKGDKDVPTFFHLGRYKCVFQMYCAQIAGQSFRIATRELWNPNTDNLISETYQGKDFVAVGLFWYVYIE